MIQFSIIISMYNLENFIQATLQSIADNQLDKDCELILVDDGSTDQTVSIAESCMGLFKECSVKLYQKDNSGVSDTRNFGIRNAEGKYLIFCDGDDFFEPGLVARLREAVIQDADFLCFRYNILQNGNKTVSQQNQEESICLGIEMLRKHLLEGYRIRIGSFAVKRELVMNHEIWFASGYNYAEDMEFIMRCLVEAGDVQFVPDVLFCYAKRTGSLMYTYNIKRFDAPLAIRRIYRYASEKKEIDEGLLEYVKNGLFVLHSIYSFDACIASCNYPGRMLKEYFKKYGEVEYTLKTIFKEIRKKPVGISGKKYRLFKFSRRLYVYVYSRRKS